MNQLTDYQLMSERQKFIQALPQAETIYATEKRLPGGRFEVTSARSRHAVLIEPVPPSPRQKPLLYIVGLPTDLVATISARFGGQWNPVACAWSVPKSQGDALRAYLAVHF